jgi:aminopeptidase N
MAERPIAIPTETHAHRLADYRPPAFLVDSVDLIFDLDPAATRVRATLELRRNPAHGDAAAPLTLDGEDLTLNAIAVDGVALTPAQYRITGHTLTIEHLPDTCTPETCTIDTDVTIDPAANTQLSGLYVSGGDFFTQCEAEGFRRITYFPDRPDVMSRFTATLIADAARYPVLLSNGNPVDRGTTPDGRAWVKWSDPHPKPAYLFALVAGDLVSVHDEFTTASGRKVALGIYVRQGDEDKVDHAMVSLKRSMRWDEEVFGLEYDLDIFNIAAVGDFNAGAMENKGLNIFNTALVLARPDTATDTDYLRIDRVIAHEYFHNWTGDRVTCRDWFQLSLKEGLTVFRDQEYGADTTDAGLSRIEDVLRLRDFQFREDGGPLAHPVRPPEYRKIDNFYTATVYEKGAEVVRMVQTIIGRDAFRRGMDIYIATNDNTAATIEDFIAAMHQASGYDFTQFMRWYDQAGTPSVQFSGIYDANTQRYTLTLRQHTAPTPGQDHKHPFVIPVAIGLLDAAGADLPITTNGETTTGTTIILLTEAEQRFTFDDLAAEPTPSLFRNFSAPIKLTGYDRAQLALLAAHDSDSFNRWEAGHEYAVQALLDAIVNHQHGKPFTLDPALRDARATALAQAGQTPALSARLLALPSATTLAGRMEVVDPDAIHTILKAARHAIGQALHDMFETTYAGTEHHGPFTVDPASVGRRALRNACLGYLIAADAETGIARAQAQIAAATTMTETLTALALLVDTTSPARDAELARFHAKFHNDPLVIDKFFAIQAMSSAPDALTRIEALTHHPDFDLRNPNRYRSLVAAFGYRNMLWFHDASGAGYDFVVRMTLAVDQVNRSIAARGMEVFADWKRYDAARQDKIRAALDRILAANDLSANTREMAERVRKG